MNRALEIFLSPEGRIPRGLWWASFFVYGIPVGFLLALLKNTHPGLALVFQLVSGIPVLLVHGKRFHDRNKSAWWVLVGAIPILGFFWIIIECGCLPGTPGPNRFGYPNLFGSESRWMKQQANHPPGTSGQTGPYHSRR